MVAVFLIDGTLSASQWALRIFADQEAKLIVCLADDGSQEVA